MNPSLLENFDNATLNYDIKKYNWPKLILSKIQEKYPRVKNLEYIHNELDATEIFDIAALVQNSFKSIEWSIMLDDFAEEYVAPLLNGQNYLIKRQPTLNVVIPNQEAVGRRLPFHQGIFYDNGRGQGTIWMPLTECYESNSMWIMELEDSRKLTKIAVEEKLNVTDFEFYCTLESTPVTLKPGQAHLFCQEHIHGNINNLTDITRFAIDWHILIEGEEYHNRLPGAFFRLPGDYYLNSHVDNTKSFICYLSNNSDFDKHMSKHAQRCTVQAYLQDFNIKPNSWQFENEYLTHLPIFQYLLDQPIDCIVVLSMYCISDDLLAQAIAKGKEIHFANECCCVKTKEELEQILFYKNFAVHKKGKLSFEE
jgi:hypothetical protein